MGKKNRRNNKKEKEPIVRKAPGGLVRTRTLYEMVSVLSFRYNSDEIRKLESKYGHLETYSNDPKEEFHILHAFGAAHATAAEGEEDDGSFCDRAIHYYERVKQLISTNTDKNFQTAILLNKIEIIQCLAMFYTYSHDMEKTISTHRWLLASSKYFKMQASYLDRIGFTFVQFKKYEYAIEVLEKVVCFPETLAKEDEESSENWTKCVIHLMEAYVGYNEMLKAKALIEKFPFMRTNIQAMFVSGRVEAGLCNYKAAIRHFMNVFRAAGSDTVDGVSGTLFCLAAGTVLLRLRADNVSQAFLSFQHQLDSCDQPSDDREEILFRMGTEYRTLKKWNKSTKILRQLCLSATRPESTMLPLAYTSLAQTYLERYCTDTAMDIDKRTKVLQLATDYAQKVDGVSTDVHLVNAQLFYFNGDQQQAYQRLEFYLDARLDECKLNCYTCKQRIREGSVPFSCESCLVASYCDRRHQRLTYMNERICHRVLCPLLGYWRMKKKKMMKGRVKEDRRRKALYFEAFFGSIGPHVKVCLPCVPSC